MHIVWYMCCGLCSDQVVEKVSHFRIRLWFFGFDCKPKCNSTLQVAIHQVNQVIISASVAVQLGIRGTICHRQDIRLDLQRILQFNIVWINIVLKTLCRYAQRSDLACWRDAGANAILAAPDNTALTAALYLIKRQTQIAPSPRLSLIWWKHDLIRSDQSKARCAFTPFTPDVTKIEAMTQTWCDEPKQLSIGEKCNHWSWWFQLHKWILSAVMLQTRLNRVLEQLMNTFEIWMQCDIWHIVYVFRSVMVKNTCCHSIDICKSRTHTHRANSWLMIWLNCNATLDSWLLDYSCESSRTL